MDSGGAPGGGDLISTCWMVAKGIIDGHEESPP